MSVVLIATSLKDTYQSVTAALTVLIEPPTLKEPHASSTRARPLSPCKSTAQWPHLEDPTTRQQEDDLERMGTLFGMLNKCLRRVGFSQMYF
ncbi:hypothetical protein CRUP_024392, partial [Coryphaenoides rupestris]